MGIRHTDEQIRLAKEVAFMPPDIVECAFELDPNFKGGFIFSKDPDCKPAHKLSWCILFLNGGDITRRAA